MTTTPISPPRQPAVFAEQATQHASIEGLLADLRLVTAGAALAPLLTELQTMLLAHFEHEEAEDGVFSGLLERDYSLVGELDALRRQHREITVLLERTVALLQSEPEAAVGAAHNMAGQLFAHEQEENELVMQTLYCDCGEND
ncbi:MAG: hemerythrin domain-containing protein [Oligoflexia bacterium]|nr:hemerythrin domain-containing protein [Oligoflexia bacterium]